MPSTAELPKPWTLSGVALYSQPFERPFADLLDHLCAHPSQHALFLNMLSLLEHMGSRKIMLSQMKNPLGQDTLKHMAEETRHAYFFKRQAEKLAGQSFDGYSAENTLCPGAARMYFGRLDSLITAETAPDVPPVPDSAAESRVIPVPEKHPGRGRPAYGRHVQKPPGHRPAGGRTPEKAVSG